MILHIPHSNTNTLGRNIEQFDIDYLTDWFTDKLFWHESADIIIFPYSRFICDVERFPDEIEPMFEKGQGICYTKGTADNNIIVTNESEMKELYNEWHKNFNILVGKSLSYKDNVIIVDCHSYNPSEGDPDICIGTNDENSELPKNVQTYIESLGYNTKINKPFAGSIVPSQYINNENVQSIMIEVNKNLYLNQDLTKSDDFEKTKEMLYKIIEFISKQEL